MFKFKPIHIHGEEPQFEHFRLRALAELVKTRLATSSTASPYFLSTLTEIYAAPAHLFAVFDQGKSLLSLDAVPLSQQRHSDLQGQEIAKEITKPNPPINSSFGGSNIANALLFRHDNRIIDVQVLFLGMARLPKASCSIR